MLDERLLVRRQAVVIGASAGALEVLLPVLPLLPADYPLPIAIVVHLPKDRPSLLVEIFAARCKLAVREPMDKQQLTPGIWFAPPGYHLLVEMDRAFSLSVDEPVHGSRPAIDVLFASAAEAFGAGLLGLVLTGASVDGADGTRAIIAAGGTVVAQEPALAQAPIMPAAAIGAGAIATTLDDLAQILMMAGGQLMTGGDDLLSERTDG